MPELRTTTPPLDFVDTEEQEIMDEEEDICKSLAEALPDNIKEEIDQVTSSSVYEFGHSSEPAKIVSSSDIKAVGKESTVKVPLQFFNNGLGLRIVGGVKCPHTGEIHAQILCIKKPNEDGEENLPEQLTNLHNGLCVLAFEGHSLQGTSFEGVRKLMRLTKNALVKLTVRDCRGQTKYNTVPQTSNKKSTQGKNDHPRFLTLQKRNRQRRSSFVLLKSEDSSTSTITKPPSPTKKISVTSSGNQSSTGSPLSSKPPSPKKKISVTSIGTQSSTGSTGVLDQFYVNMPNGMVQLSLRYVKQHKTLYVSMFKIKGRSMSLGTEQSGVFHNSYIFPDKRTQGVKYGSLISPTATTEDLQDRSASYILSEEELKSTSLRVIVWELSNHIISKKPTFKGEVFLDLSDSEIVNLEGVPQWYTICQPDPNLPRIPKPFQNTGTLMRKMKNSLATTAGAMTLRRIKKTEGLSTTKAQSLLDISVPENNGRIAKLPQILEPLRETKVVTSSCTMQIRPPTVDIVPEMQGQLSIYDFLATLNEEEDDNMTLLKKPSISRSFQDLSSYKDNKSSSRSPSLCSDGRLGHQRMSLFSFLTSKDRRDSQISQAESEFSQDSILSFSSDAISSVSGDQTRDGSHFHGWGDGNLEKSDYNDSSSSMGSNSQASGFNKPVLHSVIVSKLGAQKQLLNGSLEHMDVYVDLTLPRNKTPEFTSKFTPSPGSTFTRDSYMYSELESSSQSDISYNFDLQAPIENVTSHVPISSQQSIETLSPSSTHESLESATTTCTHNEEVMDPFFPLKPGSGIPTSTPTRSFSPQDVLMYKSAGDMLVFDEREEEEEDEEESSLDFSGLQRTPLNFCMNESSPDFNGSQLQPPPSIPIHRVSSAPFDAQDNSMIYGHNLSVPIPPNNLPTSKPHKILHVLPSVVDSHNQSSNGTTNLKHKWASMDTLLDPTTMSSKTKKQTKHGTKSRSPSILKKLSAAYENGKPNGNVHLKLTAKCVASEISVEVLDVVFFKGKLMNGDYDVKVNLYNRFNELCEKTKKGHMSLKKNGTFESKDIPPSFCFSGSPLVYYLQLVIQTSNRVFGRKVYHTMIDIKDIIGDSYEHTDWFQLNRLFSL